MANTNELRPDLLIEMIKEDREEMRAIKNRIYTNIQILIALSLALTSFFIERSAINGLISLSGRIKIIIVIMNILFLLISWIIFYFQNKELQFLRMCLNKREDTIKTINEKYVESCDHPLPKWCKNFLKKWWPTRFENDGLLFIPMCLLSLIYVIVMVVVIAF